MERTEKARLRLCFAECVYAARFNSVRADSTYVESPKSRKTDLRHFDFFFLFGKTLLNNALLTFDCFYNAA